MARSIDDEGRDARARDLAQSLDLGDWSILISPTADELAAIHADSTRAALELVGFLKGDETLNEARANLGLEPVENGDEVPAIVGQVNERAVEWARTRSADLVTQINENTRDMLRATIANAIDEGLTAQELADNIADSAGFSDARAEMISRTERSMAENSAHLDAYKESGVVDGKEWLTAQDDLVEELCEANEAQGPIPLDEDFDSGDDAPPAHPNAVFEGSLFASYGSVHQALRSRYDGPAVTIDATLLEDEGQLSPGDAGAFDDLAERNVFVEQFDRECNLLVGDRSRRFVRIGANRIRFTIGPNHPILTRRGFVRARELNEGDQLLYDTRAECTSGFTAESNLKQVMLIEDAFDALTIAFGASSIVPARTYFHGDEIFAYGKVEAVYPTRDLLAVFDPGVIEHLGKCTLKGAYADAKHVAACSSCQARLERFFLAAARGMRASDLGTSFGLFHAGPFREFGSRLSAAFNASLAQEPGNYRSGDAKSLGDRIFGFAADIAIDDFLRVAVVDRHQAGTFHGWAFDCSTETGIYNSSGVVVSNCRCTLAPAFLDEE